MILGYSDEETVMLDLDETPFKQVCYWARLAVKKYDLEGFVVLRSSLNNYHVVFNRPVDWTENVSVVAWVAFGSRSHKLTGWLLMQCIKRWPTLRVTAKGCKPPPRVVFSEGRRDKKVAEYLAFRGIEKRIWRRLACEVSEEAVG